MKLLAITQLLEIRKYLYDDSIVKSKRGLSRSNKTFSSSISVYRDIRAASR